MSNSLPRCATVCVWVRSFVCPCEFTITEWRLVVVISGSKSFSLARGQKTEPQPESDLSSSAERATVRCSNVTVRRSPNRRILISIITN